MHRRVVKCINNLKRKRSVCSVSYGYLNLTVNDKIAPYFEGLKKKIIYINNSKDCKAYIQEIKKNVLLEKLSIIGLDVEGYKIGRNGTVSLIQICARDIYLFDIYKCDNSYLFIKYLRELLEDQQVIKISHDCREDCSILYNQYNINLNNIFDTQVAYNLFLKENKKELYQISYDDLLYKCLLLNNKHKIYFHKIISLDQKIYLKRPIAKELIHYAVQDVLYLKPLMSNLVDRLICVYKSGQAENGSFRMDNQVSILNVKHVGNENEHINLNEYRTTLIKHVVKMSEQYINYQFLNSHIKNEKQLQKGMILDGMVVSCNTLNLYLKLNLSRRGVITNVLRNQFEIGDVVKCVILGFGSNDYIKLGLFGPSPTVPQFVQ
ncbi:3'-5' exonuclease domain containing protein [Plasmodium gonderi]|uniref:3'-5' exonuclease domain containing protein n=1 Tax=Plasmodium gonderi TaxID=77519 RepID=A0A1Y1JGJ5_PLAGO|nr:3'-5' exonuclease domain containing protein [Plasmodium gonderi]GAW79563.1 3'-5' exonuclease domain containing protein [Plasmodium gonderi]